MSEDMQTSGETTLYRVNMAEMEEVKPADDLIAGHGTYYVGEITIKTAGNYQRGELMMSMIDGEYIAATKAGLSAAKDICIMCSDIELTDNQYTVSAGYFTGKFASDRVILPYEDVSSVHADEIAEIKPILMRHDIFLA